MEEYNNTNIKGVLDQLDSDLVGLIPVKARIKEIASLLLVQRLRKNLGLGLKSPSVGLHMSFTGSPGTGKTAVATRMADILYKLGYIQKGHLITVTRDDLVGQYLVILHLRQKKFLNKQWVEYYLLMKLIIYISLIMREIMVLRLLKSYCR